jgi:hypothetical protein
MGQLVKLGDGSGRPPEKKTAGETGSLRTFSDSGDRRLRLYLVGGGSALAALALCASIYFVSANEANSGKSAQERLNGGKPVYRREKEDDERPAQAVAPNAYPAAPSAYHVPPPSYDSSPAGSPAATRREK